MIELPKLTSKSLLSTPRSNVWECSIIDFSQFFIVFLYGIEKELQIVIGVQVHSGF